MQKFSKAELRMAEDIFGNFRDMNIATDEEFLKKGDRVTLVNSNCEFEFDTVRGVFEKDLLYFFNVRLELLEVDYSNFEPDKSNNGGKYAFAECRVVKVYDRTY